MQRLLVERHGPTAFLIEATCHGATERHYSTGIAARGVVVAVAVRFTFFAR